MRRFIGWLATAALAFVLSTPALAAEENGALCPKPQQLQGFKTCADVAKAETEAKS